MKKLFLLFLLLSQFIFSQERKYHFEYRENRTPTGWDRVETSGDVIFYEDKHTNTITIITDKKFEHLYVKSKQLFIRAFTYLITLVDEDYNECSMRVIIVGDLTTLELYYYSDRIEDKYYRLKLKQCD